MALNLEAHRHPQVFAELQNEWNVLLERSTANRIFSTWEWNFTWWDVYKPGQLWVIVCRNEAGRLVGIAPWFVTEGEQRVVATIGSRDVSDYLDLIVDREYLDLVLPAFADFLQHHKTQFDRIELCNIPEDSIGSSMFPDRLKDYGFSVTIQPEDVCPLIELPADWAAYLSYLDKKDRHELRRKMRRAHGSGMNTDWYIVSPQHDLEAEMQHFFRLMSASDPQKSEFLSNDNNRLFFQQITAVLHQRGWIQMSFLTLDGERAAAYLNFDYMEHILVYNSGLMPDYAEFSPGIVLLAYNIQYAIETGHKVFDFLQGDEVYKYRLGARNTGVVNLIAEFEG